VRSFDVADRDPTSVDPGEPEELTGATKREGHGSARASAPKSAEPERLSRGTLVGRYVILDVLGEGGMGVVYAAFDPELDRKVAVKLLQASEDGSVGGKAWLLREAQALARLAHPNVIAVHDVGALPGDRVFVAMELVEGVNLRTWLEGDHDWREALAVMRAAGAGLAAAHAAGLVHRDFKPDNVLVGDDGRVRVLDFGLARLREDEPAASRQSDREIETRSPLSDQLTVAGTMVGTPAYMAPELYAGGPAGAATDQFSFGVAFYEALFRVRPFAKDALKNPEPSLRPRTPPSEIGVPAAIQRVVMRAISIDPAARYGSMADLLAELARDPLARRKRIAIAAGAAVVATGLIGGAVALTRGGGAGAPAPVPCTGIEARLAGAWDAATKQTIRKAFVATKDPRAEQFFTAVEVVLDRYAKDWTDMSIDSCLATRVRKDQTESDMTLRQDCLDTTLAELRAFTKLLSEPDEALVSKAEPAAWKLDPIQRCADLAALRAPDSPPPAIRARVTTGMLTLAAGKAAVIAGRLGAAINRGREATKLAREIHYDPLLADSQMVVGSAMIQLGNYPDGVEALVESVRAGIRGRRDDIAGQSALWASMAYATGLNKLELARVWFGIGEATTARVKDPRLEVKRLETEGVVLGKSGDFEAAVAAHEKALALAIEVFGKDTLPVAQDEQNLAVSLTKVDAYARAAPHYARALKLAERDEGPDHPDLAPIITGLGLCYAHTGDIPKARALYDRALTIFDKRYGPNNPQAIVTLNNLADMLRSNGQGKLAMGYIDRAMRIAERAVGKQHPLYQTVATTRAETLASMGLADEAKAQLDDVVALEEQSHSVVLGVTLTSRAQLALEAKQWTDAIAIATRALAAIEATSGKDAQNSWPTLVVLGKAHLGAGHTDQARPLLERALAIAHAAQVTETELAPVQKLLSSLR